MRLEQAAASSNPRSLEENLLTEVCICTQTTLERHPSSRLHFSSEQVRAHMRLRGHGRGAEGTDEGQ